GGRVLAASTPRTAETRRSAVPGRKPALALWDASTGALVRRFGESADGYAALGVLPDGARAVTGSRLGELALWDLESGESRPLANAGEPIAALAVAPSGEAVVFGARSGALGVYSFATGEVRGVPAGGECFA